MQIEKALQLARSKIIQGYQVIKVIGKGTFGYVFQINDLKSKETLAMKQVVQNKKYKNRQLQILKQLSSDYIVKLVHFFYSEQNQETYLHLIMEYLPQTLSSLIRNHHYSKSFIEKESLIKYTKCLLIGLQDMHICHRDIKPSNILLNEQVAKYCDFGSAKILVAGQKNISYICSRFYRAPELLFGAIHYTNKVDIWSLGCVIAQMITNQYLFDGKDNNSMIIKIIQILGSPSNQDLICLKAQELPVLPNITGYGLRKRLLNLNENCPQQLIRLLQKMIHINPNKRITVNQALQLPVFK